MASGKGRVGPGEGRRGSGLRWATFEGWTLASILRLYSQHQGEEGEGGEDDGDCWIGGAWQGIGVGLDGRCEEGHQRVGLEEGVDKTLHSHHLLTRKKATKNTERDR